MSTVPKILAFSGSTRKDSFNQKLVRIAASGSREAGAEVTIVQLSDFPLPLFDQDFEATEGQPENAKRFKQLMVEHHGFLLASPEYNSSISGVLKNTIDWVSRPVEGEPPLVAFAGKIATIMSASPGGLGGVRGLVHVRSILSNLGVIVLPAQTAVANAYEAFSPDGALKDQRKQAKVTELGKELANILKKFRF